VCAKKGVCPSVCRMGSGKSRTHEKCGELQEEKPRGGGAKCAGFASSGQVIPKSRESKDPHHKETGGPIDKKNFRRG